MISAIFSLSMNRLWVKSSTRVYSTGRDSWHTGDKFFGTRAASHILVARDFMERSRMLARSGERLPLRRSAATASPYRTPIAASSFYGNSQKESPSQSRISHQEAASPSPDSSRDEIDFLPPKSLHGRMRSKNTSVEALEVPMCLFVVDDTVCLEAATLVSFSTHFVVSVGITNAKMSLRDVGDSLIGGTSHRVIALSIKEETPSKNALASLCGTLLPGGAVELFCFAKHVSDNTWARLEERLNSLQRKPFSVSEETAVEMYEKWSKCSTKPSTSSPRKKYRTDTDNGTDIQTTPEKPHTPAEAKNSRDNNQGKDTRNPVASSSPRATRSRTRRDSAKIDAENNATILRYPSSGPHAVTLLGADFHRLDHDQFLNDTVIEFGLRYLLEQVRSRNSALSCSIHVYSTFFYMKMSEYRDRSRSYEQVKKWTNRVDVFSKRFLVLPINENMHWYLAVVVNPAGVLRGETRRRSSQRLANTAEPKSDTPPPVTSEYPARKAPTKIVPGESRRPTPQEEEPAFVFVFDSVRASHTSVKNVLRDYLRLEALDKGHVPPETDIRTLGDMVHVDVRVPEQPNSSDCGIYMLHFFECFFSDPEHYALIALESRRSKPDQVHGSWQGEHIANRRNYWRKLVLELSEAWQAHAQTTTEDDSDIEVNSVM